MAALEITKTYTPDISAWRRPDAITPKELVEPLTYIDLIKAGLVETGAHDFTQDESQWIWAVRIAQQAEEWNNPSLLDQMPVLFSEEGIQSQNVSFALVNLQLDTLEADYSGLHLTEDKRKEIREKILPRFIGGSAVQSLAEAFRDRVVVTPLPAYSDA